MLKSLSELVYRLQVSRLPGSFPIFAQTDISALLLFIENLMFDEKSYFDLLLKVQSYWKRKSWTNFEKENVGILLELKMSNLFLGLKKMGVLTMKMVLKMGEYIGPTSF